MNNYIPHDYDVIVRELTSAPWYSWSAHFDENRRRFYWGSDFLGQVINQKYGDVIIEGCCKNVYTGVLPDYPIKEMVDHYLKEHMREKSPS